MDENVIVAVVERAEDGVMAALGGHVTRYVRLRELRERLQHLVHH